METFFKTIKAELIWRKTWHTQRQAELAIFHSHGLKANHCRAAEYINGFYNPRRKHSALAWKSPWAFERIAAEMRIRSGTNTRQVHKGDVDLEAKLDEWECFYNFHRPHGAHAGKTPYEALREKL